MLEHTGDVMEAAGVGRQVVGQSGAFSRLVHGAGFLVRAARRQYRARAQRRLQ